MDSILEKYISEHNSLVPDYLTQIERDTYIRLYNPRMVSGAIQGRILAMISKMIRPTKILEIGTFTGYSTLCLAEGLTSGGTLITIERDDELEDTIRHNLSLSPLGKQVQLIIGDATVLLPTLSDSFDLVFLDGDKREYITYYEQVFSHIPQNGWLLVDNTLWDGHVVEDSYLKDHQTQALKEFNDMLVQDIRVEQVILPIRDGLTIIHKLC